MKTLKVNNLWGEKKRTLEFYFNPKIEVARVEAFDQVSKTWSTIITGDKDLVITPLPYIQVTTNYIRTRSPYYCIVLRSHRRVRIKSISNAHRQYRYVLAPEHQEAMSAWVIAHYHE